MKGEDARPNGSGRLGEDANRGAVALQDAAAYLHSQMRIEPDRNEFAEAGGIIHHIQ